MEKYIMNNSIKNITRTVQVPLNRKLRLFNWVQMHSCRIWFWWRPIYLLIKWHLKPFRQFWYGIKVSIEMLLLIWHDLPEFWGLLRWCCINVSWRVFSCVILLNIHISANAGTFSTFSHYIKADVWIILF